MRSLISAFCRDAQSSPLLLSLHAAHAQTAADAPVACVALIESAARQNWSKAARRVIANPATSESRPSRRDDYARAVRSPAAARSTRRWPRSPTSSPRIRIAPGPSAPVAKSFAGSGKIRRRLSRRSTKRSSSIPTMPMAMKAAATPSTMPRKYDRAIEDYNEALRLKPDFAQAYSDRGAAWYFKGEYQKAIADYDQAIQLEPDNARAYTNRGARLSQDRPHRPGAGRRHRGDPDRPDRA